MDVPDCVGCNNTAAHPHVGVFVTSFNGVSFDNTIPKLISILLIYIYWNAIKGKNITNWFLH